MINTVRTLIIVMLISVFYLPTATAEITIDDNTIHVETNNYKVQFDYGAITYLHNKLTDETYTLPLESTFLISAAILSRNENFWARRSHTVETQKINEHTVETLFQEDGNEITLVIAIDPNTDDLLISGDSVSDTPGVYAIQQWAIDNLNPANLRILVPSEKLQVIDATVAIDHRDFRYPHASWEAQLAIIESQHGGFYVRSKDTTFQFKSLFYKNHENKFSLSMRTENQAPWDTLTTATSVTWRLNTYAGDWCVPAQIYRDWMEEAFDPWKLSDMPPWVKDIGLVIIHFLLDVEMLPSLAELVDSTKTLLYLTDWRKEGHGVNYPDYSNPHERFELFLETAHQYGFRVMLHVNIYDMSPSYSRYPEFQRYQYRFPETGELSGWRWKEIDSPYRKAHISLASSEWRNLLLQEFKAVWEKYNIDAFHLDVSSHILNDANGLIEGLTSAQGNVLMHKELAEAMPGVVFSGEGLHEVTFFRESFAQRREAILGPHHPLTAFLFSPYTRFYGGLDTPGILDPLYQKYLENAENQGYLPTFWVSKKGTLEVPPIRQILSTAQQRQALNLLPDVNCDWKSNTLFQYTTHTGETVTHNGSVLVMTNPDLNRDGQVNILDLIFIANKLGQQVPQATPGDLNGDGGINILDLVFVAEHLSQNAAAPAQLRFIEAIPSTAKEVIAAQRALNELDAIPNKSHGVQIAIKLLRHYLAVADRNVKETQLLPNYPNPFNPDTWIPYQLSEASTVTVKIYDVTGSLIRTINVGHKPIGYYLTRERAVYWDGQNQNRESVSSGVYFYTLNTDTYTQTRRMVILK